VDGGGAPVCCVSGVRARPSQQRLVTEGRRLRLLSLPLPLLTPLCRRRRSCGGGAPNAFALWASRVESC
jgi:hypothetical protein